MNSIESTVDDLEVNKFANLSQQWWDLKGPLKTLHDINPARLAFIAQHIQLSGLKVLDVGCGGGILSEALTKAGATVTGLDAEADSIQTAINHAHKSELSIHYLCSPIEDYDSAGFDVVVCMELLEHVQNPELVLQHCKRLLKPNGLLFLSTISRTLTAYASAIIAAEYVLQLLPKQTHDYSKFIKPSELSHMARINGLKLLDMQGMHYNPLTGHASLCSDVSTNYLMAFQKPCLE